MKDFLRLIQKDMMAAMRLKEKSKSQVLKSLISDLTYSMKSPKPSPPMDILIKSIKKRSDALEEYKKASRLDLLKHEEEELLILEKYLPKRKTDDELLCMIQKLVAENGKDFGKVMKKLTSELNAAEAPRDTLSKLVKSVINK